MTDVSGNGTTLVQATYVYDVFGQRIEKDVWTQSAGTTTVTRYAYRDGQVWAQLNSSNGLQTRYIRGNTVDELFARESSTGAVAWYLTDREGSAINLMDASGMLQDTITYDGYGSPTQTNPSLGDQFLYGEGQYDSETGLQYNEARYYNPQTGRWTGEDPLSFGGGDSNLYRYVFNDPTNASDPSGLEVWLLPTYEPVPGSGSWHYAVVWYDPGTGEAISYNGSGPGGWWPSGSHAEPYRTSWGTQIGLMGGPTGYQKFHGNPQGIRVATPGMNTQEQKARLEDSFKRTRQIPEYCCLTQNSNTYAHALLVNAGFPDPPQPPGADGWPLTQVGGYDDVRYGYGGDRYNKYGQPYGQGGNNPANSFPAPPSKRPKPSAPAPAAPAPAVKRPAPATPPGPAAKPPGVPAPAAAGAASSRRPFVVLAYAFGMPLYMGEE